MILNKIEVERQQSLFPSDKVRQVADFLLEHYEIVVSVHDPSKKYISCKDFDRKHVIPTETEISLHLSANNINIGESMLRKILRSPYYIPHVDPITKYFDSIKGKWKGTSAIDSLCNHITFREWDDKPAGEYTQRAHALIKKWLVACVAQWIGDRQNDVCLGLVQAKGGSGKTWLTEWLLPESLRDYYCQSSNNDSKFNVEDAFTRYMFVHFEELDGLKRQTINSFKKCLSALKIAIRERNQEFAQLKQRIGCALLSTNFNQENGGFFQPWYGSDTRRFGNIEILDIDQDYSDKIDVDMIWSEALTLYESKSYDYIFRESDYNDFNEYNARYRSETKAMQIIQMYVQRPEGYDDGERLSPTEILQRLVQMRKVKPDDNITAQKIGHALTTLGFMPCKFRSEMHNKEPRDGYHVKFIEQ
jgi:hypothetical protein